LHRQLSPWILSAAKAAIAGIHHSAYVEWQRLRGGPLRLPTIDRRLLEQELLPAYARRPDVRRALFCGCAPYTRHYASIFATAEYWTLDPNPARRRDGASHHIVDSLQRLQCHDHGGLFDLIVCNGVLGWGLDTRADAEAAITACDRALRAGGHLLLGWNDVYPRNRVQPEAIRSLQRFVHAPFSGWDARLRVPGPGRHVFDFYRKPRNRARSPDR
jgi:SAM-dependent methyltransferase